MQTNEEIHEKICESNRNKARPRCLLTKTATPCFRTCLSASLIFFFLDIPALKMNGAQAVLDPKPKLLDSNFVESSKLQLLFRPSGKYAASTHFIHIWVPFNFSQLTLTPTLIFNQFHRCIKKWPEPFRTQVEEVAEISRSCLTDKLNNFNDILDALPQYEVMTKDKHFLDLVALSMSAVALTLSSFNLARILTLEMQIINKCVDHLVDITSLHENHFRAVDKKLDDVADKLATLIKINKVHFAKMTDFMEQKFGTALAISKRLIHTAYNNRLAPGALHHEALTEIVKNINKITQNSNLQSFGHQPSNLFLVETSYIYKPDEKFFSWCSTSLW
jgi:hypothetical protein